MNLIEKIGLFLIILCINSIVVVASQGESIGVFVIVLYLVGSVMFSFGDTWKQIDSKEFKEKYVDGKKK